MSNPSKQKGTKAETEVVMYLRAHGFEADRKALSGNKDEGDIQIKDWSGAKVSLEVKAGQQTANPNRKQMEEWLDQADAESSHAGQMCYLVVRRYRRFIGDAEVWYRDEHGVRHMMYLSEFAANGGIMPE